MTVRIEKPTFNLREKLSELDKPSGIKGNEILRSETTQDVRDLISAGRKNKLINGAMMISQRGTSFDSNTSSDYTLDRFQLVNSGGITFDATVTQDSSAPDGFRKSLKISPDTVETSMSGSENAMIQTKLDGQDCQDFAFGTSSAKKLTISFYAKSGSQNNNHQYTLQIRKYDDSNNRNMVNRAFTVTTSWQRYIMTFDGDTAENIRNDNSIGIQIIWHLASGPSDIHGASTTFSRTVNTSLYSGVTGQSNFLDNTSNEFYLTGCQIEVGGNATEFEHRTIGEELVLCHRYYQQIEGYSDLVMFGSGRANGTTEAQVAVPLTVPLRGSPTIPSLDYSTWGPSSANGVTNGQPTVTRWFGDSSIIHLAFPTSSLTNGRVAVVSCRNGSTLQLSSEL
tara:strand:- start:624 stop:1808 length:1185 start_codon:yes stop_codon:yes gene_type:complete